MSYLVYKLLSKKLSLECNPMGTIPFPRINPPRCFSTESNLTTHRTNTPNDIKLVHIRIDMLKQDLRKLKQLIVRVRRRLGSKVGYEQKLFKVNRCNSLLI